MTERAESIVNRVSELANGRGTLENHWNEIAERMLPSHSQLFTEGEQFRIEGQKRTHELYDSTAAIALERFGATMESMLTPRNSTWHSLRASDESLMRIHRVAVWFDEVKRLLFQYRYSPKANYSSQQHQNYIGLGAFGTACMFVDQLQQRGGGMRYKAVPLSNIHFLENHQGLVDTVFRTFTLTSRQAVQKWPKGLPGKILDSANKKPDEKFEFIHAVQPRTDYDPQRADAKGKPFMSLYIAREDKTELSEGGFLSFPYAVSRYVTAPGEIYGRSPGMLALPTVKTLNEEKKTVLKQGQRITDPVLLANDDGAMNTFSLHAGAINYGAMSKDGRRLVDVLPTGNIAVGLELMQQEQATINDIFLVTLFQILVDSPQMTATEVLERAREKGALISPTMGRQQSEALGPMIERELDLMAQQRLLPPMPPELIEAEGEYTVQYDSPLSRAQRAEEASGMYRALEFALGYFNQTGDASALDHFDMDTITPEVMQISGVPAKWRRSLDQVAEIRNDRAKEAEDRKAIEAAPAIASLAKGKQGGGR